MQQAYWDSKTYTIRDDENENMQDTLVLTIQNGEMPPFSTNEFTTRADLLNFLNENGLSHLTWDEIEGEGI